MPMAGRCRNQEVGNWLTAREKLWETLEDKTFSPIEIDGRRL